jgi:hypothetical protein
MKLILKPCSRHCFNIPNVRSNIHVTFLPVLERTALLNGSQNSPALPSEKKNGTQKQIDMEHL